MFLIQTVPVWLTGEPGAGPYPSQVALMYFEKIIILKNVWELLLNYLK